MRDIGMLMMAAGLLVLGCSAGFAWGAWWASADDGEGQADAADELQRLEPLPPMDMTPPAELARLARPTWVTPVFSPPSVFPVEQLAAAVQIAPGVPFPAVSDSGEERLESTGELFMRQAVEQADTAWLDQRAAEAAALALSELA